MTQPTDDQIIELIQTRKQGTHQILYRDVPAKSDWMLVDDQHIWNFAQLEYQVNHRKRFLIKTFIDNTSEPEIEQLFSGYEIDKSKFGKVIDGNTRYTLVQEIYPEEIE
jgi:hypothetical protein